VAAAYHNQIAAGLSGSITPEVHAVPGPIAGAGLPGLIFGERWPSRLVATAEEDRLSFPSLKPALFQVENDDDRD